MPSSTESDAWVGFRTDHGGWSVGYLVMRIHPAVVWARIENRGRCWSCSVDCRSDAICEIGVSIRLFGALRMTVMLETQGG